MDSVLVIGAAGRVGYPFMQHAAAEGFDVYGYDLSLENFERAKTYIEEKAPPNVTYQVSTSRETYFKWLASCDVVVIMVGTPVDAENNPRTDNLDKVREDITEVLKSGKRSKDILIVLRSTVSPGTTEIFYDKLTEDAWVGFNHDITVVFAPERIAQGHTHTEMPKLPQIIGSNTHEDYLVAESFFMNLCPECIELTIVQAELGKLFTNMYRYVNFALANEFFTIAHQYGEDYDQIRAAINKDYPRMNLEKAGPNSAGPCLFKDGQFLVAHNPYVDLIKSAFSVNEGMPGWIYWNHIAPHYSHYMGEDRVCILGMTFKADNDDTRHSLSYKLKKILKAKGVDYRCYDPYVEGFDDPQVIQECNIIVVMTPHSVFDDEFLRRNIVYPVKIIDIWQKFPESKKHLNGIYEYYGPETEAEF
jgi:UDP-N-acetyl-D-mannosaminuronic acid dehydrogenase